MIKCCIFDLDGTLLNTITTITHYVNSVLADEGIAPISEDECKIFVGNGADMLIKRSLLSRDAFDETVYARVLKKYIQAYDSSPLYLTEPYPGIHGLISELLSRGILLGVVSNKPESATVPIVKEFFGDSFSFIRGGRAGASLKPSPDVALESLGTLGIDASMTAFIGDTSVDILTGKNMSAGLSIGVLWGFRKKEELLNAGADAVVSDCEELLREVTNG